MLPQNRNELKEWALRKLGRPVIKVNIDAQQMDDRISEAIDMFQKYHVEGTEETYVKHVITEDDIANKYITVPDSVASIRKILPVKRRGDLLFDVKYHYMLSALPALASFDIVSFQMFNKHISMLNHILSPKAGYTFNRIAERLYLNINWEDEISEDDIVVFGASVIVDPSDFPKIYGDEWVRNYTVALFRQQWAQNMGKYRGISLPGNVTLDVETMERKSEEELQRLIEQLERRFQAPAHFIVG